MPYQECNFPDAMQYSFNYKSLHLISFATDVFFQGSDKQIQTSLYWLEQDLIKATQERSRVPWIIVIGHRPLYCTILSDPDCHIYAEILRSGDPNKSAPHQQQGLESLFTKYNVDLYLW